MVTKTARQTYGWKKSLRFSWSRNAKALPTLHGSDQAKTSRSSRSDFVNLMNYPLETMGLGLNSDDFIRARSTHGWILTARSWTTRAATRTWYGSTSLGTTPGARPVTSGSCRSSYGRTVSGQYVYITMRHNLHLIWGQNCVYIFTVAGTSRTLFIIT